MGENIVKIWTWQCVNQTSTYPQVHQWHLARNVSISVLNFYLEGHQIGHCSYIIIIDASYVYSIHFLKISNNCSHNTVIHLALSSCSWTNWEIKSVQKTVLWTWASCAASLKWKVWKKLTAITECEFPLPQSVCSTLWCTVGTTCHSKLDGAVDGTSCGEDKVSLIRRRGERFGPWGGGQLSCFWFEERKNIVPKVGIAQFIGLLCR